MCTSIILFRKKHKWPLILASNRDEFFTRKSKTPARHWANQPYVTGGLDKFKGGTWCSVSDSGIISCIHNRNFKIKNFIAKKTRGEIILKILRGKNTNEVKKILQSMDFSVYNGFNLVFGNNHNAFWVKYSTPKEKISINTIPEGISIITNSDLNDYNDKKIKYYIDEFSKIPSPDPEQNNWLSWERLLAHKFKEKQAKAMGSICFNINNNFGTVSSSIISVKNKIEDNRSIIFRYTKGPPNISVYKNIKVL